MSDTLYFLRISTTSQQESISWILSVLLDPNWTTQNQCTFARSLWCILLPSCYMYYGTTLVQILKSWLTNPTCTSNPTYNCAWLSPSSYNNTKNSNMILQLIMVQIGKIIGASNYQRIQICFDCTDKPFGLGKRN